MARFVLFQAVFIPAMDVLLHQLEGIFVGTQVLSRRYCATSSTHPGLYAAQRIRAAVQRALHPGTTACCLAPRTLRLSRY